MKNKIGDLNDHLFAAMERLSDEALTAEELDREVRRSRAIVAVADKITANHDTAIKATRMIAEYGDLARPLLPMIANGKANGHGEG